MCTCLRAFVQQRLGTKIDTLETNCGLCLIKDLTPLNHIIRVKLEILGVAFNKIGALCNYRGTILEVTDPSPIVIFSRLPITNLAERCVKLSPVGSVSKVPTP
jgi:hypothetical protein